MNIGSQSMVAPLRTVLVKDPRASHVDQATVDAQWQTLHYPDRPDLARVQAEYAAFFATLADFDLEIGTLPPAPVVASQRPLALHDMPFTLAG